MPIPQWAASLIVDVSKDEGLGDWPLTKWRRSRKKAGSSGCAFSHRIVVTAGADGDRGEQRLVLLHELAHWIVGVDHGHDATFYEKAWRLYEKHEVDLTYALQREGDYKKTAIKVYHKLFGGS